MPGTVQDGFGIMIIDVSEATLDKAVRAGFKVVRIDLQWGEVEQIKGRFNWAFMIVWPLA
jgi:hypothetical protein